MLMRLKIKMYHSSLIDYELQIIRGFVIVGLLISYYCLRKKKDAMIMIKTVKTVHIKRMIILTCRVLPWRRGREDAEVL